MPPSLNRSSLCKWPKRRRSQAIPRGHAACCWHADRGRLWRQTGKLAFAKRLYEVTQHHRIQLSLSTRRKHGTLRSQGKKSFPYINKDYLIVVKLSVSINTYLRIQIGSLHVASICLNQLKIQPWWCGLQILRIPAIQCLPHVIFTISCAQAKFNRHYREKTFQ